MTVRVTAQRCLASLVLVAATACAQPNVEEPRLELDPRTPHATELTDFPSQVGGTLAADAVQGLAHDDTHWYLLTTRRIWKVPLDQSLASVKGEGTAPFAGRYMHLGDADYQGGVLYVPLENDRRGGPRAIGALRPDLTPIGVQPLNGSQYASWCAVDARGQRLYTSSFNADRVQVFRIELSADHFALVFERDLVLKRRVRATSEVIAFGVAPRIQGGALSAHGDLYLASDALSTGILVFDVATGILRARIPVNFAPRLGPFSHQELEGLDLFDVGGREVPSISGTVHVLLHDELPKRAFSIKHWALPPGGLTSQGEDAGPGW
jgi:hypothetical protein